MFARERMTKWTVLLVGGFMMMACGGNQQPKSFVNELTADDSLSIAMGDWVLTKYHSDKLAMDIYYPSFLERQHLSDDMELQELFLWQDVSISVIVDSLKGMMRTSGQIMMGMGSELIDVGDDFSIHQGEDDQWEYYGKVIDSDSLRQVTVILRYYPEHADAVDQLKEWVKEFEVR